MFCKNCGNPVNGTPFCTACGTKVDTAAPVDDLEATVMADDTAAAMAAAEAAQAAPVQPAYQQPVQPAYQQPVQPAYEQPDQPAYEQPVQPAYQQPVQPAYQQPVQPAYQQPVQPAYEQPSYQQPEYMPPEPPKKKNTGLIIGIAVASIVAVVGIVVAILFGTGVIGDSKKDKDDDDDEPKTTASQQVDTTNVDNNNDDPIEIPSNAQSEAFTIGGNVPITQAIPTNPMPTQPSGSQSTANYIIGNDYMYIPISLDQKGYDKMIAATTIAGDSMYIEVDYNGDFEYNGGVIYVAYDTVAINIIVDSDGYYSVYLIDLEDNYQVYNATDDYETEDVETYIMYAYLMGFDLDEGFDTLYDSMPPHYTYQGTTTHSYLGTVDVFTFSVGGSSYEVWVDTETGATARLYEDGSIVLETTAVYADNSLEITDLS